MPHGKGVIFVRFSMAAPRTPHDLVRAIDREKADHTTFTLSPRNWRGFRSASANSSWLIVPFKESAAAQIPSNDHGIYTFVIDPKVCGHHRNSFVAYVGKADKMTIRARFLSYFQDKKRLKRPQIAYLLNKFPRHLEFCFLVTLPPQSIGDLEDALIAALDPPFNRAQPASVRLIRKGLV